MKDLAGDSSQWMISLLDKKVFSPDIQSVKDLVFSFTVKKDSKSNKINFVELIQKNVRKKDKNIKSCVSETSKLEDITDKYLDKLDSIHLETFESYIDKAKKPEVAD